MHQQQVVCRCRRGGAATCTTKELKDKSGVKIICGGDSIGVVLNGKDGADGKDGKNGTDDKNGTNGTDGKDGDDSTGCSMTKEGTVVTITYGENSTTIDVGQGQVGRFDRCCDSGRPHLLRMGRSQEI